MIKKAIFIVFILFLFSEIFLRIQTKKSFFGQLLQKEVTFYDPFILNEKFIYSHHPNVIPSIAALQSVKDSSFYRLYQNIHSADIDLTEKFFYVNYLAQLDHIQADFGKIDADKYEYFFHEVRNDLLQDGFKQFKSNLLNEFNYPEETELNQAIRHYTAAPINSDGFRSIEMKPYQTERKKILLIGDSYVYGYSASPFYHSFADQLLAKGYVVYNAGIPGTDCLNYLFNARYLIDKLQPDYVFTFLYLENDIARMHLSEERGFIPYHATNLGWHSSIIGAKYYPNNEKWLKQLKMANNIPQNGRFFTHSAVIIWLVMKWEILKKYIQDKKKPIQSNEELTNSYLKEIETISKNAQAKSTIIVVPECRRKTVVYLKEEFPFLFNGINVNFPTNFNVRDFRCEEDDQHFNNNGHLKMMEYILELMDAPILNVP